MARMLKISRDDAIRVVARVLRDRSKMSAFAADQAAAHIADALLANSRAELDAPPCTDRRRVIRNSHEGAFVRYGRSRLVSEAQGRALFAYLFDTLAHDFRAAQAA